MSPQDYNAAADLLKYTREAVEFAVSITTRCWAAHPNSRNKWLAEAQDLLVVAAGKLQKAEAIQRGEAEGEKAGPPAAGG